MPEHGAEDLQGRVCATGRSGLQDDRAVLGFGGGDIGTHVLPTEGDETGDCVAVAQGGLEDVGKRDERHD